MNRFTTLAVLNVVAYVSTLVVNFLSQSASVLGVKPFPYTVAELGESRALFFLPAGYVFAIWGVIYLGLGAFAVYQARAARREAVVNAIGWWFVVSSLGNIAWLVLFLNNQIVASTAAMLVILAALIAIYLRLDIGRAAVSPAERWAVHIPFSIYLGWITVATVANFAAALYDGGNVTGWLGIGADVWAVAMIAIAFIITLAMIVRRRDVAYALVVVWALVGIYVRPFTTPVFEPVAALNAGLVDAAALILAIGTAVAAAAGWFLRRPMRSA